MNSLLFFIKALARSVPIPPSTKTRKANQASTLLNKGDHGNITNLEEICSSISTYFAQHNFSNTNPGHCWNNQCSKQVIINIKIGFVFTHIKKVNIRKICDAYFRQIKLILTSYFQSKSLKTSSCGK
jgi:hypothetical protein